MIEAIRPDVAFLDIKMPGLSGMQVARETAGICRVVFITAYDQYAVDAFENEAVDYILKPATIERLSKTVTRLKAQIAGSSPPMDMSGIFEKPIAELAEELDPEMFFRIHRGTIVNANHIEKVSTSPTGRGQVRLIDRPEIHTVSRSYAHLFKQM